MPLYRTILVAYDGTAASDVALRQGAGLAAVSDGVLHALAIVNTSEALMIGPVVTGDLILEEQLLLRGTMETAVGLLGEQGRHVVTGMREGDAASEILGYAREIKADLLVIGHTKHGWLARWLEISMSSQLLGNLPCSLLIARDKG